MNIGPRDQPFLFASLVAKYTDFSTALSVGNDNLFYKTDYRFVILILKRSAELSPNTPAKV